MSHAIFGCMMIDTRILEVLEEELREITWPNGQSDPVSEEVALIYNVLASAIQRTLTKLA